MLVDFYPPPMHGIGRSVPGSSSDYLRRQWISGAWRRATPLKKLVFCIVIAAWFPGTVVRAAQLAFVLGPSRQRVSGKSPFRQFLEQLSVAAHWMVPPKWYYIFEFFDDARRAQAGEYLQRVQTKPFIFRWLVDRVARKNRAPFADKVFFSELCQRHDLPATTVIALVGKDAFHFLQPEQTELPPIDLFVKIKNGQGGRGAEKWCHQAGGYIDRAGRRL